MSFCFVYSVERKRESKNPRIAKTNKEKLMLLSEYSVYDSKKLRFMNNQEASELLNYLGSKAPLSKISIIADIFFLKI